MEKRPYVEGVDLLPAQAALFIPWRSTVFRDPFLSPEISYSLRLTFAREGNAHIISLLSM
jgi:hypothetical protein